VKTTIYILCAFSALSVFAGGFDDYKRHCLGPKDAAATEPQNSACVGMAKIYDYEAETKTLYVSCESREARGEVQTVTLGFRCELKGAPTWRLTQKSDTVRTPTSVSVLRGNQPQAESISSPWRQPPR